MENIKNNKMASEPIKKLFWKMGLPMIISMVLQALYNVVDSIFVANMGSEGALANEALTYAFPIQILIIAVGVGTGIGLNALLSKSLGEKDKEKVNKVAGNGIFLALIIYLIFLIFGMFCSKWFISIFTVNKEVIKMGTSYLRICTCLSLGSIGYTVYERFLQGTGKTNLSTISQISGAVANIILDYIFIYPLNMGVAGAAWATVAGQFLSLFIAMYFHYTKNKEISGNLKYIKPDLEIIKGIYRIGLSAAIMQALLSVMMAGENMILTGASVSSVVLVGSFGIYYKIQQIALFSAFGLSNTIITILSFNYGMKDKERCRDVCKYGILDTCIVTLIITIIFELFASPLANLFGLTGSGTKEIIEVTKVAIRVASLGYIFMGFSVAVQGILQSLGYALKPLIISLLRLVIFVFPISYIFTKTQNVLNLVWLAFPISEILTSIISYFILKKAYKEKIESLGEEKIKDNLIITIAREHGTNGKEIGRLLAKKLNIAFYDKEEIKNFGIENKLIEDNDKIYDYYLSLNVEKDAIIKQAETIKRIADKGDSVIVGRASDYILRNNKRLIRVFLYAGSDYRIKNIMKNYKDNKKDAIEHIKKSDKARKTYYEVISNKVWGDKENYDIVLDTSIGNNKVVEILYNYVKARNSK